MPEARGQTLDARLYVLGLTSPDPQHVAAFYGERMGMTLRAQGDSVLARGPERLLCFSPGRAKTMNFAGYSVRARTHLDALRVRLARDGVAEAAFDDRFDLFDGDTVAVRDPNDNLIVFGIASDAPAATDNAAPAARLQHCVVASRDAQRIRDFYIKTLGFQLSDNVQDEEEGLRAAFLRSDNEHHSFAVFRAPTDRFDHHCYEVADWNAIRDWGDHFAKFETVMQWGPGRHGPGNNLFFFVHDPDGNWVEFSAELEVVANDRPVGVWPHAQRTLNYWGSAPLRS